ncbi:MAG: AAA family ATPase [Planctomycetota bacterium]
MNDFAPTRNGQHGGDPYASRNATEAELEAMFGTAQPSESERADFEAKKAEAEKTACGPMLLNMDGVEPADVSWLWPKRVPLGRMTLLVGRPGEGKSFLTAQMAANVSRGRTWPDGSPCPQGSVLLCSAEDDPADTIAPRLIAHDADRSRVHLLAGVRERHEKDPKRTTERGVTLADLDEIRESFRRLGDCRLIVVDPVGSFMGGKTDAHRDNEVRGVLAPVARLAAEHDAALLVVAHNRKSSAAHADDTALGSRAFTGLARSVLHFMADPDAPPNTTPRRLLLPGKCNLSERAEGLAFDIGPGDTLDAHEKPRPCIHWHEGAVSITADEAVNREPAGSEQQTERDEAAEWLRATLNAGPRPSKEVIEEAREVEGISKRTLDRAKKEAGVETYRPENPGPWYWRLINPDPTTSEQVATDSLRAEGWQSALDANGTHNGHPQTNGRKVVRV